MATESATLAIPELTRRRLGWWRGEAASPTLGDGALEAAIQRLGLPVYVLDVDGQPGVAQCGVSTLAANGNSEVGSPLVGYAPALLPEQLLSSQLDMRP